MLAFGHCSIRMIQSRFSRISLAAAAAIWKALSPSSSWL